MSDINWTVDYSDDDLTFWMLVHHDHDQAVGCLRDLRRYFPRARVIVRSDGDSDARHASLVARFDVEYYLEERLFPVENGGVIVQRMFEQFFDRPTRYLFKIDPDTAIHRRFRYVPADDCHFGSLQGAPSYRCVQGGCMGFTADVAAAIADSQLMLSPRLTAPIAETTTVRTHWSVLAERAAKVGLASFDWSLGWAVQELNLPLADFPEVYCKSNKNPARFVDNGDLRFAVTHPLGALIERHAKSA